jgi:hypothetical protein
MSAVTLDTAIAALTVTGLTIKGLAAIPQEVFARDCPILFPSPSNWLGQSSSTPGNFDNVIAGRITVNHTLTYILAYAQEATGRGFADHYAGMAALEESLRAKIMRIDITAMSIKGFGISVFGPIQDPAGKGFYGVICTVTALEYIP